MDAIPARQMAFATLVKLFKGIITNITSMLLHVITNLSVHHCITLFKWYEYSKWKYLLHA